MIEIHLFGSLRRYAPADMPGPGTVFSLGDGRPTTVGQVLSEVGIDLGEVGNLFLNGRLLPRSNYPITLGYPLAAGQPLTAQGCLDTRVEAGDRLGIFPRTMSLVVV